jgi:hypothetical protein
MTDLAPGLHALTVEQYTALPYVNWSTAKMMQTSPKLVRYRAAHPRPDTAAFGLGRAIHACVLEPDRWVCDYAGRPDFGDLRTKAGRAARDAWVDTLPASTMVLSAEDHALAELCAGEIHAHPHAHAMLTGGRAEQCVLWLDADTGLRCKARLDYLRPTDLIDLKSTRRETPRQFLTEASALLYHGQIAWYHDGCIAAGVLPPDADLPGIVTVQTTEPYDVAAYRMTRAAYLTGRSLWRSLLRRYAECELAGYWPGIGPSILDFDVMPWAAGGEGEETDYGEGDAW